MVWSKTKTKKLKKLYSLGYTYQEIAVDLGVNFNQIHNKIKALGLKRKTKKNNIYEKILDQFAEAQNKLKKPQVPKKKRRKKGFDNEIAVALMSDLHIGQETQYKETMGINEYSFEIFGNRFWKHIQTIQRFKEIYSYSTITNHLYILMLGDMLEGETIFTGQQGHIDLNTTEQIVQGSQIVALGINELCSTYPKVTVIGVPGNHGRIGKKGEAKGNLDTLFYYMVAHQLDTDNCEFYVSDSLICIAEINKKNFVLAHGEQMKSWMGIPFYAAERTTRRLADIAQIKLNYALYAHHHQPAEIPVGFHGVLFNGTYVGGSELSVNKMILANPPTQKYFHVHEKKGITVKRDIILDYRTGIRVNQTGPIKTPTTRIR